jgi:hypothetical protein
VRVPSTNRPIPPSKSGAPEGYADLLKNKTLTPLRVNGRTVVGSPNLRLY